MTDGLEGEDDELVEAHAINVTPFIDVVLVLLIIFMVAAPLSTVPTPVDLPGSNALADPRQEKRVVLTLNENLALDLSGTRLAEAQLPSALNRATTGDRERRVYLEADKRVPYGEVMHVMNDLRAAGYFKIALVGLSDPQSGAPP